MKKGIIAALIAVVIVAGGILAYAQISGRINIIPSSSQSSDKKSNEKSKKKNGKEEEEIKIDPNKVWLKVEEEGSFDWGEINKSVTYQYNDDGKLTARYNNKTPEDYERYEYDEKGRKIKMTDSSSGTYVETRYEYNDDNKVTLEEQKNIEGKIIKQIFRVYEGQNLISETEYGVEHDPEKDDDFLTKKEMTYDSHGNKLSEKFTNSFGNYSVQEFTYDENDREITHTWFNGKYNNIYAKSETSYSKAENGNDIKTEKGYTAASPDQSPPSEPNDIIITEYDKDGNKVKEDNTNKKVFTRTVTTYDKFKNAVEVKSTSLKNDDYSYTKKDVDENGHVLLQYEFASAFSPSGKPSVTYAYDYDENGNMIKEYHYMDKTYPDFDRNDYYYSINYVYKTLAQIREENKASAENSETVYTDESGINE